MVNNLTHEFIIHLIFFQAVVLLVILSNIQIIHRIRRHLSRQVSPFVSILLPARNEEKNIANCVSSLLAQDYPSFEVLVLDDQSEDKTRFILEEMADSQPRLTILEGKPTPQGKVGKNWACSQLAEQAKGDLYFFTDADTFHHPGTLNAAVTAMLDEQADLLTGFPRQELHTWGEKLLVPFFSWAMYSFNPLILAYRIRLPVLSIAVGQMMLFRREAYLRVGGHDRVSSFIVEDLTLARRIKEAGLRWRVIYVADLISCRMYQNTQEAVNGFAKNLFSAFNFRLVPFVFIFIWLMMMFLEPIIVLFMRIIGQAPLAKVSDLIICFGLSLLLWLIPFIDMRIPIRLAFLYPFMIILIEVVAFLSLKRSLWGELAWKGRTISRPRWRWL